MKCLLSFQDAFWWVCSESNWDIRVITETVENKYLICNEMYDQNPVQNGRINSSIIYCFLDNQNAQPCRWCLQVFGNRVALVLWCVSNASASEMSLIFKMRDRNYAVYEHTEMDSSSTWNCLQMRDSNSWKSLGRLSGSSMTLQPIHLHLILQWILLYHLLISHLLLHEHSQMLFFVFSFNFWPLFFFRAKLSASNRNAYISCSKHKIKLCNIIAHTDMQISCRLLC